MDKYQPNSHRFRDENKQSGSEREKVKKVVKGSVKTKQKSELRKFADTFISEDASTVKSFLCEDVVVPTAKKFIWDLLTSGLDMFLFGGKGQSSNRAMTGSKVSYGSYYNQKDNRFSTTNTRSGNRFDYDDIIFESRGEAEAVRSQMEDVIGKYGFVTVADMYDMAGLTEPYTSNKYGWISIRTAEVIRIREGYVLKLPKAAPID